MRYVLVKMSDSATEKFVKKAGKKAIGVWDVPSAFCECPRRQQLQPKNWAIDGDTEHRFCVICGGTYRTVTSLATRLRMAFLGRNMIKHYR